MPAPSPHGHKQVVLNIWNSYTEELDWQYIGTDFICEETGTWLVAVQLRNDVEGPLAYIALYNATDSEFVSGSEISLTGSFKARTAVVTLTSGKQYAFMLKTDAGGTARCIYGGVHYYGIY